MKLKSTLTLLALFGAAIAGAQPTLTSSNSMPVAGLSDQVFSNATYAPGSAGANQSWDFSAGSYTSAGTQTYSACNGANNCAAFPGSNLVGTTSAGSTAYYKASSTAFSITGAAAGGAQLPYADPEDEYRFPITYNTTYVDPWSTTFTNGSATFYRKGADSVTGDGWGTLKTPAGTFSNALRIKRISTYQDSAVVGGLSLIIKYRAVIYTWNDINHKDYLYTTSSLVSNNQGSTTTTNYAAYTSSQATGIDEMASAGLSWQVSPNPARGAAQALVSLNTGSSVSLSVTDLAGRVVSSLPQQYLPAGNGKLAIPLEGLSAGIYTIRLTVGTATAFKKLVVAP